MKNFVLNVVVTDKMVKEGVKKDCEHCPVALAIREAISKNESNLEFGNDDVFVEVGSEFVVIRDKNLPDYEGYFAFQAVDEKMKNFVNAFDWHDLFRYIVPAIFSLNFERKA